MIAESKEVKRFIREEYIHEKDVFPDLSIVSTRKSEEIGNLVFRKTVHNSNPAVPECGKVCVVEVEGIVPTGSLDYDNFRLPGSYVHRMGQTPHKKRFEHRTTRQRENT